MPIQSPFHARTARHCTSLFWKEWAGYHAVRSYDTLHEREYFAIRHTAGLIDVTPLYKYEVAGPDAAAFLSWVMVRDIHKLKVGRVTYLCWCDDDGKVADDGTVSRFSEDAFRVTAAEPALAWLQRHAHAFDVDIQDSSEQLGALALQGPSAREILKQTSDADLDAMKYFDVTRAKLDGFSVEISRTGYTGDLGYEIWVPRERALPAWDAIMHAGKVHGIQPAGLDALDVTRIEAAYIMNGVDYFSAHHCPIESRKSTPYELGLGWAVKLKREPFVGQTALQAEKLRGSKWAKVGLMLNWSEYEALFAEFGLPPQVPSAAWRNAVPLYNRRGRQIGQATSGAWSPTLKQNLALATVETAYATIGTEVRMEVTSEYQRRRVTATVTKTPFFDPERKRAVVTPVAETG